MCCGDRTARGDAAGNERTFVDVSSSLNIKRYSRSSYPTVVDIVRSSRCVVCCRRSDSQSVLVPESQPELSSEDCAVTEQPAAQMTGKIYRELKKRSGSYVMIRNER